MNSRKGIPRTRAADIDLGIAVSHALTLPGQRRTHDEIALYAGVRRQTIQKIEKLALQKLKKALFLRRDPVLNELMQQVLPGRS